jgi:FtsP/CotA-like multicopper oxidase with cupredoxin domain
VRLRVINASAMSIFNCRIPGLPMTVVQADGVDVQPVETDEFQISIAETYDVIVQPLEDRAYMAETAIRFPSEPAPVRKHTTLAAESAFQSETDASRERTNDF